MARNHEVKSMPEKKRILCYGDSLTAGFHTGGRYFEPYGETLMDELGEGDFHVDVMGHCGATTEDMMNDLEKDLQERFRPSWKGSGLKKMLRDNKPYDLVILLLGTNDIGTGIPSERICSNLKALHDIILSSSEFVRSIALGIPGAAFLDQSDELRRRWMSVNNFLENEAKSNPRIDYIPFPFGLESDDLYDDGVHFSLRGNQELGIRLTKTIREKFFG